MSRLRDNEALVVVVYDALRAFKDALMTDVMRATRILDAVDCHLASTLPTAVPEHGPRCANCGTPIPWTNAEPFCSTYCAETRRVASPTAVPGEHGTLRAPGWCWDPREVPHVHPPVAAAVPGTPPTANPRVCTCTGFCKGPDGLAPGWVCAIAETATRARPTTLEQELVRAAVWHEHDCREWRAKMGKLPDPEHCGCTKAVEARRLRARAARVREMLSDIRRQAHTPQNFAVKNWLEDLCGPDIPTAALVETAREPGESAK